MSSTGGNHPKKRSAGDDSLMKKEALDRLRTMEWKRNKSDKWFTPSKTNSGSGIQDGPSKKNMEDGSTSVSRHKRRQKQKSEQMVFIPQENLSPENVWVKKKGTDLFKTSQNEDEDEILQKVLAESLMTAEQERKHKAELERQLNLEFNNNQYGPERMSRNKYCKTSIYYNGKCNKTSENSVLNSNDLASAFTSLNISKDDEDKENIGIEALRTNESNYVRKSLQSNEDNTLSFENRPKSKAIDFQSDEFEKLNEDCEQIFESRVSSRGSDSQDTEIEDAFNKDSTSSFETRPSLEDCEFKNIDDDTFLQFNEDNVQSSESGPNSLGSDFQHNDNQHSLQPDDCFERRSYLEGNVPTGFSQLTNCNQNSLHQLSENVQIINEQEKYFQQCNQSLPFLPVLLQPNPIAPNSPLLNIENSILQLEMLKRQEEQILRNYQLILEFSKCRSSFQNHLSHASTVQNATGNVQYALAQPTMLTGLPNCQSSAFAQGLQNPMNIQYAPAQPVMPEVARLPNVPETSERNLRLQNAMNIQYAPAQPVMPEVARLPNVPETSERNLGIQNPMNIQYVTAQPVMPEVARLPNVPETSERNLSLQSANNNLQPSLMSEIDSSNCLNKPDDDSSRSFQEYNDIIKYYASQANQNVSQNLTTHPNTFAGMPNSNPDALIDVPPPAVNNPLPNRGRGRGRRQS